MSLYVFLYMIFITFAVRVSIFMTSPLGVAACLLSIYKEVYLQTFKSVSFYYTGVVVSGKVCPLNRLTTPVVRP